MIRVRSRTDGCRGRSRWVGRARAPADPSTSSFIRSVSISRFIRYFIIIGRSLSLLSFLGPAFIYSYNSIAGPILL